MEMRSHGSAGAGNGTFGELWNARSEMCARIKARDVGRIGVSFENDDRGGFLRNYRFQGAFGVRRSIFWAGEGHAARRSPLIPPSRLQHTLPIDSRRVLVPELNGTDLAATSMAERVRPGATHSLTFVIACWIIYSGASIIVGRAEARRGNVNSRFYRTPRASLRFKYVPLRICILASRVFTTRRSRIRGSSSTISQFFHDYILPASTSRIKATATGSVLRGLKGRRYRHYAAGEPLINFQSRTLASSTQNTSITLNQSLCHPGNRVIASNSRLDRPLSTCRCTSTYRSSIALYRAFLKGGS